MMYRFVFLTSLTVFLANVSGSPSLLGEPATLSFRHRLPQAARITCKKDDVIVFTFNPEDGNSGSFYQNLVGGRASFINSPRMLNISVSRAMEADDGFYHCQFNDTANVNSRVSRLYFVTFTRVTYTVTSSPKVDNKSNIIRHFIVEPVIINFRSECSKPPVKYTIESRKGIFESKHVACDGKSTYGVSTLQHQFYIKEPLELTTIMEHPSIQTQRTTFMIELRPQCEMLPCKNGGTCVGQLEWYRCKCPDGYKGTHCQLKTGEGVSGGGLPVPTIIGICIGILAVIALVVGIVLLVLHYKRGYLKYKARRKHATFGRYIRKKLPRNPSMKDEDSRPIASKYKKVSEKDDIDRKKRGPSKKPRDKERKEGEGQTDGAPLMDKNENTPAAEGENKDKQRHRVEKSHSTRSQDGSHRPRHSGEGHRREGRESSKDGKDSSRRREGRDPSKGEEGKESSRRREGRDPSRRDGKESFRDGDRKDGPRVRREPSGGRSDRQRPPGDRRDKDRSRRAPSDAKDRKPREHRERRPPPDKDKDKSDKERTDRDKTERDTKDKPAEAANDTSNATANVTGDDTSKHDVSGLKVL